MADIGIAAHARATPDKIAIVAGARRITYAELDHRIECVASLLASREVAPDDRVAIALRNRPEFLIAAAAAARLGAHAVPVSWRFKSDEVAYMVEDSNARVIVAEADGHVAGLPALLLEELEGGAPAGTGNDPPFSFRYYTSGTSGRPKAVERESAPDIERVRAFPTVNGCDGPDEVHLACGPLYHTAPCAFASYALLFGQTLVIMEHFDAAECLRLIEHERVTWTHMVPINFTRILGIDNTHDLSSLKRVLHAAAPCPVDVKRRIMNQFPSGVVTEYYGMTEGLATVITADEWRAKPGSVGRAAPGLTLKILDANGVGLPPGETGIVYVSGARFSYAGAPEKTAETWRGDLFTVGDMGYLDDDGYLFLTDRAQDMIISGGANIYPAEVEAVLLRHPGVTDVAVIGVPDAEFGEAVHAIVEGALEPDALIAFARERLAHFKCPRTVELVAELPRDPNGKVRKRELRAPHWEGRATRI